MTRRTWQDLALELAELRAKLVKHAERAGNDNARSDHLERVKGVALATRVVCRVLRAHYRRFDGRVFMKISVGKAAK